MSGNDKDSHGEYCEKLENIQRHGARPNKLQREQRSVRAMIEALCLLRPGQKQLCQVLVQVLLNFVFYIASTSASIVHPLGWGAISSQGSETHLSILSVGSSNSIVPIYTPRGREALTLTFPSLRIKKSMGSAKRLIKPNRYMTATC